MGFQRWHRSGQMLDPMKSPCTCVSCQRASLHGSPVVLQAAEPLVHELMVGQASRLRQRSISIPIMRSASIENQSYKTLRLMLESCRATLRGVEKRKPTPETLPGCRTKGQSIGVSEERVRPATCYPLAESTYSLRDPKVQKGGGSGRFRSVGSHAQRGIVIIHSVRRLFACVRPTSFRQSAASSPDLLRPF